MTSNSHHIKPGNSLQEKSKTVRRHGACNPCKTSKTKCDGAQPCSACRSEKRKSRTCEYSDKALGIAAARQQIEAERLAAQQGNSASSSLALLPGNDSLISGQQQLNLASSGDGTQAEKSIMEAYFMCRPISLCDLIDEFIQVKPPKGQAAQAIQKSASLKLDRGLPTQSTSHREILDKIRDFSTETTDSNDHPSSPLAGCSIVRRKLDFLKDVASEGHISEVWVELGKLVREVQVLPTVQHNVLAPHNLDNNEQRRAWLDMLELDCFLSFTLGQSSSLPRWQKSRLFSTLLQTESDEDQYHSTRLDILQTMQKVLDFDMSHTKGIVEFLHFARRFIKIKESDKPTPIEKIATCTSEKEPLVAHNLKIMANLLLMVIFCRTASICSFYSQDGNAEKISNETDSDIIKTMELHIPRTKSAFCRLVIKYAKFLLDAFTHLCQNDFDNTAKDWIRCYSATIAAIMIGVAKLREKNTDFQKTSENLGRIETLFRNLSDRNSSSSHLSNAAIRIRELNIAKSSTHGSADSFSSLPKPHRKSPSLSVQSSPTAAKQSFRSDQDVWSPSVSRKRSIEQVDSATSRPPSRDTRSFVPSPTELNLHPPMVLPERYIAAYMGLTSADTPSLFTDNATGFHHPMDYNQAASITTSVNSSFAESDGGVLAMSELPLGHPGPPFVFPWDYSLLHPPMVWNVGFAQEQFSAGLQQPTSGFAFDSSPLTTDGQIGINTHVDNTVHLDPSSAVANPSSPTTELNQPGQPHPYTDTISVNTEVALVDNNSFFNMTAKPFEDQRPSGIPNQTGERELNAISQPGLPARRQSAQENSSEISMHASQRRCSVDVSNHYHNNNHHFNGYGYDQSGNLQMTSNYPLDSQGSNVLERSDFEAIRQSQWRRMSIDTGSHYM